MTTRNKFLTAGITIVVLFFAGLFTGRLTVKTAINTKTVTVTKKVPYEIIKTLDNPVPYAVHDTVPYAVAGKTIIQKVDTTAILADYHLERDYNLDYSTDSLGTFKVDVKVVGNKIIKAKSTMQPIVKYITTTNTITRIPAIQFYGMVGSSIDLSLNQVQAGIDLGQKYMIGASAIRYVGVSGPQVGYTINVGIKF